MARYKICSSFPLHEIINFHKDKETEMIELAQKKGDQSHQNQALVTVVGARVESEGNKNFAFMAVDDKTQEMMHYAENASAKISNLVNSGIYFFSVRIFSEYGVNPFPDDQAQAMIGSTEELQNTLSPGCSTPKEHMSSNISGSDFVKNIAMSMQGGPSVTCQQNEGSHNFHQYSHAFMYLNSIEEAITIKDLLMPMCGQKKVFVYEIDETKDFYKEIVRHEDKLNC